MEMTIELLFFIIEVQVMLIICLLIYIITVMNKKTKKKPDKLVKHVKEYIVDGYTLGQAREKLQNLGFDKERIDKVMSDFIHH